MKDCRGDHFLVVWFHSFREGLETERGSGETCLSVIINYSNCLLVGMLV